MERAEANVRRKARQVMDLERRLALARQELIDLLGPNGRVTLDGGTFQAVPKGWHPDAKFTQWLVENHLLAAVLDTKPVISMGKVNALAAKRPELSGYITLARAAASDTLVLRFRAASEADAEDRDAA